MVPWWTAGRCPLEYGVIGLISKCSASGSACAQTVLLWHNVPCKCDLVYDLVPSRHIDEKTKAAPPFTVHLHNACSLEHVERTSF